MNTFLAELFACLSLALCVRCACPSRSTGCGCTALAAPPHHLLSVVCTLCVATLHPAKGSLGVKAGGWRECCCWTKCRSRSMSAAFSAAAFAGAASRCCWQCYREIFQEKCSKNGSACARHKFGNNANNTSHQQHGGWEVASKGNELGGCEGIVNAVQYPMVL